MTVGYRCLSQLSISCRCLSLLPIWRSCTFAFAPHWHPDPSAPFALALSPPRLLPRFHLFHPLTDPTQRLQVLTMSFEEGCSIGDVSTIKGMGVCPAAVARLISDCFNRQIYTAGSSPLFCLPLSHCIALHFRRTPCACASLSACACARNRKTDRLKTIDRQTDRQTDTQTHR